MLFQRGIYASEAFQEMRVFFIHEPYLTVERAKRDNMTMGDLVVLYKAGRPEVWEVVGMVKSDGTPVIAPLGRANLWGNVIVHVPTEIVNVLRTRQ